MSDFGLSLSLDFDLSGEEKAFFENHENYDQYCAAVNLLHCIITTYFGSENWIQKLQNFLDGDLGLLPVYLLKTIEKYAPIAFVMDNFFMKLQRESKTIVYPALELRNLYAQINTRHKS